MLRVFLLCCLVIAATGNMRTKRLAHKLRKAKHRAKTQQVSPVMVSADTDSASRMSTPKINPRPEKADSYTQKSSVMTAAPEIKRGNAKGFTPQYEDDINEEDKFQMVESLLEVNAEVDDLYEDDAQPDDDVPDTDLVDHLQDNETEVEGEVKVTASIAREGSVVERAEAEAVEKEEDSEEDTDGLTTIASTPEVDGKVNPTIVKRDNKAGCDVSCERRKKAAADEAHAHKIVKEIFAASHPCDDGVPCNYDELKKPTPANETPLDEKIYAKEYGHAGLNNAAHPEQPVFKSDAMTPEEHQTEMQGKIDTIEESRASTPQPQHKPSYSAQTSSPAPKFKPPCVDVSLEKKGATLPSSKVAPQAAPQAATQAAPQAATQAAPPANSGTPSSVAPLLT